MFMGICTKCCMLFATGVIDAAGVNTYRLLEVYRIGRAAVGNIRHIKTSNYLLLFTEKPYFFGFSVKTLLHLMRNVKIRYKIEFKS